MWSALVFLLCNTKVVRFIRLHDASRTTPKQKTTSLVGDGLPLTPQLLLTSKVKVMLAQPKKLKCPREMAMIKQGLEHHPFIEEVYSAQEARFILWMTVCDLCTDKAWLYKEFNTSVVPSSKLVVIDFSDSPDTCREFRDMTDRRGFRRLRVPAPMPLAYFKRSFPKKGFEGEYLNKTPIMLETHLEEYYPTNYAVLDQRVGSYVPEWKRKTSVLCTLRGGDRAVMGAVNKVRARVTGWLKDAVQKHGIANAKIGPVTTGQGKDVVHSTSKAKDDKYMKVLRKSKIIVTANPSYYEGDSRLWEALASGAMVMSDTMYAPLPNLPVHGESVVYFDSSDTDAAKRKFVETLKHYVDNPAAAARIGKNGYALAMRHHRPVNRVDDIVVKALTAEMKLKSGGGGRRTYIIPEFAATAEVLEKVRAELEVDGFLLQAGGISKLAQTLDRVWNVHTALEFRNAIVEGHLWDILPLPQTVKTKLVPLLRERSPLPMLPGQEPLDSCVNCKPDAKLLTNDECAFPDAEITLSKYK